MAFVCEVHGDTRRLPKASAAPNSPSHAVAVSIGVASGNAVQVAFDLLDAGAIAPCSL